MKIRRVLGGETKKSLMGNIRGWGTIYLDNIVTTRIYFQKKMAQTLGFLKNEKRGL